MRKKIGKTPYIVEMKRIPMRSSPMITKTKQQYCWFVKGINGKPILKGCRYKNRTHCRNVARRYAEINKHKFKELIP